MKLDLKKLVVLGTIVFGAMSITSCLNNDDSQISTPVNEGYVSFYNVSPDSNGLNFYNDDRVVNATPVNFPQFLNYLGIEEGVRKITVNSSNNVLDTLSLNVIKNKFYSVFATNEFNNLELTMYEDALLTPSNGKIGFRFIHLSPDTPQITVKIEDQVDSVGIFNYRQALAFKEVNPINNKNIYLINTATQDTLISRTVNLTSGKLYTILGLGFLNTTNQNQKLRIESIGLNL